MRKQQALGHIRTAKASLVQWKPYIQAFCLGLPVDAKHLPVISTDSTYSKWYLNEGQELAYLDSYYDINGYLEDCFQRFQALHKEVNTPAKKSSLFCSKEKCERERKERIDLQANNLYVSINNLIDMTKRIETQIMNLTDEEFEELL
jgi:hypothetical protein